MADGMMPGLAGLAQGLRLAGGVLSPKVFQTVAEEDQQREAQAERMKQLQIAQTVKGIEMGAIEPEAGRAVLKQMGFDAPVGLSAEGQARMEKVKQQRAIADAIAKLPPDATPAQKLEAMFPHLPPEQQVRLHEINTVKVQNLEQQLQRIDDQRQLGTIEHQRKVDKDANDARLTAMELGIKQQIADLKAIGGERSVHTTTIQDPYDPTKAIVIDANTGRKIGNAPPKAEHEKALPTGAGAKIFDNQQNLRRADEALKLLKGEVEGGDPDATGWKGYIPQTLLDRWDSGGVSTRAAIADLGSLVIHDRSGAAVTAAEFPRLRPFIPRITDRPDVAKKKLERFYTIFKETSQEMVDFYKESGYRVPEAAFRSESGVGGGAVPAPAPAAPSAPATGGRVLSVTGANPSTQISIGGRTVAPAPPNVGDIRKGYRFKGGDPSNQENWEKI